MSNNQNRSPKRAGYWALQEAKARFSELVRCARSQGAQHVTVHGREEVVIMTAEEYRQLKGGKSGAALVEAIASAPHTETDLDPKRYKMPVRDVEL